MADEPQGTDNVPEMDTAEATARLRQMLETLVPPDLVIISDIYGNEYKVPALLPARAQVVVMRHLEQMMQADIDASMFSGLDAAALPKAIITAAGNEVVLNALASAFQAAHPAVYGAAMRAHVAANEAAPEHGSLASDAADLFPVEDMVSGLLPFCVRLGTKLIDLMGPAVTQAPTPA